MYIRFETNIAAHPIQLYYSPAAYSSYCTVTTYLSCRTWNDMVGSLKMNTTLEYSTRVVQEGDRRCKKSTLNDLAYLTPLRIPLMNPVTVCGEYETVDSGVCHTLIFPRWATQATNHNVNCQGTPIASGAISKSTHSAIDRIPATRLVKVSN